MNDNALVNAFSILLGLLMVAVVFLLVDRDRLHDRAQRQANDLCNVTRLLGEALESHTNLLASHSHMLGRLYGREGWEIPGPVTVKGVTLTVSEEVRGGRMVKVTSSTRTSEDLAAQEDAP